MFDICHGCRRCVSLCQSFPNLFDLVDATEDGEVHGVKKEAYWSVVDQCYLCDLCYMTKCPYTPPHVWNLDFPHLMLRAKAIKFKKGEVKASEKFLASTDVHGSFAGIPIVVQAVNAINKTKFARQQMDSVLGVHPDAWMPELATKRFPLEREASRVSSTAVIERPAHAGPRGDLLDLLHQLQRARDRSRPRSSCSTTTTSPTSSSTRKACCGMPKFELGDLDAVERHKNANIPVLAKLRQGWFCDPERHPELHL